VRRRGGAGGRVLKLLLQHPPCGVGEPGVRDQPHSKDGWRLLASQGSQRGRRQRVRRPDGHQPDADGQRGVAIEVHHNLRNEAESRREPRGVGGRSEGAGRPRWSRGRSGQAAAHDPKRRANVAAPG